MTKMFYYNVNGTEFTDTKAFGVAWHDAVKLAKNLHTGITRTVISEKGEQHEFLAKGGCFLNERFYTEKKVKIF